MTAFAGLVDRLFADPNLGRDAIYEPADGEPISVRVVARRADAVTEFGGARLWSETTRLDVRVAEVAEPAAGRPDRRSTARPSSCRASRCGTASGCVGARGVGGVRTAS